MFDSIPLQDIDYSWKFRLWVLGFGRRSFYLYLSVGFELDSWECTIWDVVW